MASSSGTPPLKPHMHRSILSIPLLKPSIQFKFIATVFIAIFILCTIIGFFFHYSVTKEIAIGLGYTELYQTLMDKNIILTIFFFVFSILVLIFSVFISHRFAGPIYRFEKTFESLSRGDLTHRVTLRKDDELFDVKDRINAMIASLQSTIQKDNEKIHEISTALDTIIGQLESGQIKKEAASQLRDTLSSLQTSIRSINTFFNV